MDCKTANNLCNDWLDGELCSGKAALLQRHLDECRACAREARELQSLLAALRESRASDPAPEGFALRVMDRLQAEPLPSHRPALFSRLAVAASFIFLLGMNSLLLGRYLSGNRQATPPAATEPTVNQVVIQPPHGSLPGPVEEPKAPALPKQEEVPAKLAPLDPPKDGQGVAADPAERQPDVAAPVRKATAARVKPPRPATPTAQAAPVITPEPAAAKQRFMTVTLPPATIPDPEVFMPKRRVTEGSLLKMSVTDLPQASQQLTEAAERRGLTAAVASVSLADDGRLIKVYRYEVPWLQAGMFIAEALRLGRVLDERHISEDISAEYGQKLEQHRQLTARVKVTEGAEAAVLYAEINALLMELARMNSAASGARAVTVWLEG